MSINKISSSPFLERAWPILAGLEESPLPATRLKRKLEQTYALSIEPGTFYVTLAHLERRGWIEHARTFPLAYVYSLTDDGRAALQQYGALASSHHERIQTRTGDVSLRGGIMKLATWVVKLYPRKWRERYEEEMLALLTEHPITFLTIFDLFFGVLDARLDPHYRTERHLFALKRPHVAVMSFFAVFAVFLFLVQGSIDIVRQGATALFLNTPIRYYLPANTPILITMLTTDLINGVLCFITLLVAFASMRRIVAARRIGMALLAAVCFVSPIVLVPFLNVSMASKGTFVGISSFEVKFGGNDPFWLWIGLELLMGMLLLTVLKIKQAITTRSKGMLFLVILIDALLILRAVSFFLLIPPPIHFPPHMPIPPEESDLQNSLSVFASLATNLMPFSAIGVLLLTLAGNAFGEWTRRLVLAIVSPVTLTMIMYLLLFLIGGWIIWTTPSWQQIPVGGWLPLMLAFGAFPMEVAGAGLLVCTFLAFVVCRSLLLALPRKPGTPVTKDDVQELPAMEMQ